MGEAGTEIYGTTGSVEVVPLNDAFFIGNQTIGTSSAQIAVVALERRRMIVIRNLSTTATIFFGPTSGVTTAGALRGWKIDPETEITVAFGSGIDMFLIASAVGTDVQFMEAA